MAKLVCTIELDKEAGFTLRAQSPDGSERVVTLTDKSITLRVKGTGGETTLTQDDAKVSIKCTRFEVEAETIQCTAKREMLLKSEGTLSAHSQRALELKSSSDLKAQAASGVQVDGQRVSIAAQTRLGLSGATSAELRGGQVSVRADAAALVEGQMTATLKGGITTVSGQLINLN